MEASKQEFICYSVWLTAMISSVNQMTSFSAGALASQIHENNSFQDF